VYVQCCPLALQWEVQLVLVSGRCVSLAHDPVRLFDRESNLMW
jgi:hypothetical protein